MRGKITESKYLKQSRNVKNDVFVKHVGKCAQTETRFFRADRPADSVEFVLAFWPHSDLLAKMLTADLIRSEQIYF